MRNIFSGSKIRLLALSLMALMLGAHAARANGVSQDVTSGEVVTGNVVDTIANGGYDDYYIYAPSGSVVGLTIAEVGAHNYDPVATLYKPSGAWALTCSNAAWQTCGFAAANSGTWHIQVSHWGGGLNYGDYKLTVIVTSSPTGGAGDQGGGAMVNDSSSYSGTDYRSDIDVFSFKGIAGTGYRADVNVDMIGSWSPAAAIYRKSTGAYVNSSWNSIDFTVSVTGSAMTTDDYMVLGYRHGGADTTQSYALTVTGSGVDMSTDGKSNGTACCVPGGAAAGEPVNIANGNVFDTIKDYTTVGTNPLAFIRYYTSQGYGMNTYATALGPNWRHNYDRYLRVVNSSQVMAERQDGRVINFKLVTGVWTPDSDVDYTLTGSGSNYTLTGPDDVAEAYSVTSGKGTLSSLTWPSGYSQTMTYTTGKLTSVSDSYSRSLTLSYTGSDLTGVSTPDSATLTYGYTSAGGKNLLTSITYNTSPTKTQTYVYADTRFPWMLTSITDENGNTYATWTYDGTGRATSSEFAGGADHYDFSYDDSAHTTTVTNALGNAETYSFTTSKNMRKLSSISRAANSPVASATRNFTYDANGYRATATDWNGNSTHWTNNSHGLPTSITEAYGTGRARTTSVTYDSTWARKPYTVTKTNQIIDLRYDGSTGTLTSKTITDDTGGSTDGNTEVWAYTYNGTGQMLTETFPRTGTTVKNTYTYSGGALATITDQLSHVWTVNTANGTGQPTQITDQNGVVIDLAYNNRNWLTSKTVNASTDEVTGYTYTASGQLNVVTLPDGSTYDYDYDNAHRLTKITNYAGETINYTLNDMGGVTAMTLKDAGGNTKKSFTATYDVLNDRLTLVGSGGANETTSYAYDGMRNRTSTTDANSKVWSQAWDELLRPTTVTDPLTHTAAPTYNNLDYVTAQTDFNGYSTSYTRDGFGNAIARSSPDTGSWSFTFNEDNLVTAVTDARSVASSYTYDAADRLTAKSITGYSGENETYTYDDTTGGNKGINRLTSWTDESGSGSRIYDNFGNITSETRVIGGKTYTTTYTYDLANRITQIIYPSGRYVNYTYDSSGYLTTVTTKPSAGGGVTTLASSITHKPFGPIASFTYGNSEAQTRTFNNNYWLTDLDTVYSGTYVQQNDYGYDYAGNLTSITDNIDNTRNETFTVDDLNRLHTASGKYGSRTYTYDNNSNRATEVIGATTYTYTNVSSKNRLDHYTDGSSTRNFTYTANGNMATDDRTFIGGGSVSNTFGGRDRLESQTVNAQSVTFKINAFGQRDSKAFSGTTTHFVHDVLGDIIAEANGSTGSTTKEYVWMEGELLAQIDSGGNIVYVHNAHIGAPQKITNPSRTVVFDQIREPFGEIYSTPTSTTPTNHRFPGQYADAENSLSYNNSRDYDSSIGRYVQADLIGFAGGPNVYTYSGQNPARWVDFLGLACGDPFSSGDQAALDCMRDWKQDSTVNHGKEYAGHIVLGPDGQYRAETPYTNKNATAASTILLDCPTYGTNAGWEHNHVDNGDPGYEPGQFSIADQQRSVRDQVPGYLYNQQNGDVLKYIPLPRDTYGPVKPEPVGNIGPLPITQ
jgi:RHS repeat-associated protein